MKKLMAILLAFSILSAIPVVAFGAAASVVSTETTIITVDAPKINMIEDEGDLQDGRSVVVSMSSSNKLTGGDEKEGQAPVCAAYVCWYTAQGRFVGCTVINDVYWSYKAAKKLYTGSNSPAVNIWPTEYPLKGKVFVWTAEGSVVPISDVYEFDLLSAQGIIERDLPGFYDAFYWAKFDTANGEAIKELVLDVCEDLQARIDQGVQLDINEMKTITYKSQIDSAKSIYKSMGDSEKSAFTATFTDYANLYPDLKILLLNMFDISSSDLAG